MKGKGGFPVNHNLWRTAPEIIITVIGFAALLKGAALIVVPQAVLKANDMSARVLRAIGAAFVVVGSYLGIVTYFG